MHAGNQPRSEPVKRSRQAAAHTENRPVRLHASSMGLHQWKSSVAKVWVRLPPSAPACLPRRDALRRPQPLPSLRPPPPHLTHSPPRLHHAKRYGKQRPHDDRHADDEGHHQPIRDTAESVECPIVGVHLKASALAGTRHDQSPATSATGRPAHRHATLTTTGAGAQAGTVGREQQNVSAQQRSAATPIFFQSVAAPYA